MFYKLAWAWAWLRMAQLIDLSQAFGEFLAELDLSEFEGPILQAHTDAHTITANLGTKILDFRGFDSNIILTVRRELIMSEGTNQQSLRKAILVGIILVGRLGVQGTHVFSVHI